MRDTKITSLRDLRQATRWREESASEVFRTNSSWEWFKRNHQGELVAAGALIPGRGRRGDLVTNSIDEVVASILLRESGANHG